MKLIFFGAKVSATFKVPRRSRGLSNFSLLLFCFWRSLKQKCSRYWLTSPALWDVPPWKQAYSTLRLLSKLCTSGFEHQQQIEESCFCIKLSKVLLFLQWNKVTVDFLGGHTIDSSNFWFHNMSVALWNSSLKKENISYLNEGKNNKLG